MTSSGRIWACRPDWSPKIGKAFDSFPSSKETCKLGKQGKLQSSKRVSTLVTRKVTLSLLRELGENRGCVTKLCRRANRPGTLVTRRIQRPQRELPSEAPLADRTRRPVPWPRAERQVWSVTFLVRVRRAKYGSCHRHLDLNLEGRAFPFLIRESLAGSSFSRPK